MILQGGIMDNRDKFLTEKIWGKWVDSRCRVCGWPIADRIEHGCIPGNCSQRPLPEKNADSPVDFSTWENFGRLWQWAKEQEWWPGFIFEHSDNLYYRINQPYSFDASIVELVDPTYFADAVYEYLNNS